MKLEPENTVSRKLIAEIASGKRDLLTQEELRLLAHRNESKYGQALFAFASDREQGRAVVRAMIEYEPDPSSSANFQATIKKK